MYGYMWESVGGLAYIYTNIISIILLLYNSSHTHVTGLTFAASLLDGIHLLIATVQIKCTAESKH